MNDIQYIYISKEKNKKNNSIFYSDGKNIKNDLKKVKTKYVVFIKETDDISTNYFKLINKKIKKEFDCCFINYEIKKLSINNLDNPKNEEELKNNRPYYGDYIFSYIFKTEQLKRIIEIKNEQEFDQFVDKVFKKTEAIGEVIYSHNPKAEKIINNFPFNDIKKEEKFKNIIYIGNGCNCKFNGYVSWINNIGRCFGDKYEIIVLYDKIHPGTFARFSKNLKCINRKTDTNYICDRLLVTYSNYYYPKNVIPLENNYMFIHGNMDDYKNAVIFSEDIYTNYVAVSKTAGQKARGYYPTKRIDYVLNPFKLEKELVKPRLKLTSALRYGPEKRPERIDKMASILDELDIPYTWEVFTDKRQNTNHKGLIFRESIANPIPYVADSDYFVHLSNTESYCYSIIEALAVKTKLIITPLPVYEELGIKNKKDGYIIPFEYFDEEENKEKLKRIILEAYKDKDRKMNYKLDSSLWEGYKYIFK
ncbi:MAG: glycosyltransferase [Bacilli bacterium]|nr:glycosyltransferase [Bacilli bacterium]